MKGVKMSEYRPKAAIHPGRTLQNYLTFLGVSQKWLAERTGLTEKHISEILNENASITAETAIRLSNTLGGSVEFWVNLDSNYRATLARIKHEKQAAEETEMLDGIPYADMVKVGWVMKTRDKTTQVINLYSFFGVSSLRDISVSQPAAFRKSDKNKINEIALAAWLRKGEILANCVKNIPDYNEAELRASLGDIKEVLYDLPKDFFVKICEILAKCGVILVAAEYLPKTYVNGATRWVGHHPIIELSDRGKQDDILWFTLFHEIGHILKHGKKDQFVDFDQSEIDEFEKTADDFASEALLPNSVYNSFLNNHKTITKTDILSLSSEEHIPPSIISGRLKRDRIIPYTMYSDLHRKLEIKHK